MCLVKRRKPKTLPSPSATVSRASVPISTNSQSKARSRMSRGLDRNSLENSQLDNSHTNSSKESRLSSSSVTSLASIREMLSDGPIIFQFKDLCKATNNFSASKKVGTAVYRGSLHKTEMAIVVDKRGGAAAENNDFVTEIKNLGSVHHANLVRLLGGCVNGDHVYVVYDYINGGNLRQYLHSAHTSGFSALPTWMSRIQVALEVSKGLEYLHHHTHMPTLHKYIKSSNILLDNDLHVKIAYFGVAKLRGETGEVHSVKMKTLPEEGEIKEVKEVEVNGTKLPGRRPLRRSQSIKITGTHGYMAPEYVNGGVISTKLDVFAFGVILLEILSGKKAASFQTATGANHMKKTLLTEVIISICGEKDPKGRLRAWIDPLLKDRFPLDCALRAAQLARNCVDPLPELRPDMSQASMTLLQIQMSSQIWSDKMKSSRDLLTSTVQAR